MPAAVPTALAGRRPDCVQPAAAERRHRKFQWSGDVSLLRRRPCGQLRPRRMSGGDDRVSLLFRRVPELSVRGVSPAR